MKISRREERCDLIKSWIKRKYRYNFIVQIAAHIFFEKITAKNDIYCANKQNYMKSLQQIIKKNDKLKEIKGKFFDTLIAVQNSSFRIGKIGSLCWY